jgi:uncharacterized protein YegP (UPF0339 family)
MSPIRRLVVYRRSDGLYDWKLIAPNGEVVASSLQGFTEQNDAVEAANREFEDYPVEIEEPD